MADTGPAEDHIDFDLHGFVGIRLLAPTRTDVATLVRQIGPLQSTKVQSPDIIVKFVDRIADDGLLTYVDWPGSGFTRDSFYLLRGRHAVPARTRLDLDQAGGRCEIVCERRGGPVPHLLALMNLVALTKGVLPLHASAFDHHGVGVLATGWAKGGKTEVLLAFAAHGARYVGDEWVYLTSDGQMYGVPEPIRLWYWHVEQLQAVSGTLSRGTRTRLAALPRLSAAAEEAAGRLAGRPGASSLLRRVAPVVRRQATVQVSPYDLFGADGVALHARLDTVLLVTSHENPEVTVAPVDGGEVAGRMAASLDDERSPFLAAYRQFRYAFPGRASALVDTVGARESQLLDAAFTGRPTFRVSHPYPMRMSDLVAPVEAVLAEQ